MTVEQDAQRSCGYPIIASFQGQIGHGIEKPDAVKDAPAHGGGRNNDF